jgi:hypothetical protein
MKRARIPLDKIVQIENSRSVYRDQELQELMFGVIKRGRSTAPAIPGGMQSERSR